MAKTKLTFYKSKTKQLNRTLQVAINQTAEALKTEVIKAQVMPFDVGTMQNNMFVDETLSKQGIASLVVNSPQARRLYFHPEYNYQTINNANAGGEWFKNWLPGGVNQGFVPQAFATLLKRNCNL